MDLSVMVAKMDLPVIHTITSGTVLNFNGGINEHVSCV